MNVPQAHQPEMEDALYDEICRVWEQFRIANLNVRYYGSLADRTKSMELFTPNRYSGMFTDRFGDFGESRSQK